MFDADVTHTYTEKQDQLVLKTETVHFAGFKKTRVLTVYYLEYEGMDPDTGTETYNVVCSEYYPDTKHGSVTALRAFTKRLESDAPQKFSGLEVELTSFLETKVV